jgi:hypothetical protein
MAVAATVMSVERERLNSISRGVRLTLEEVAQLERKSEEEDPNS